MVKDVVKMVPVPNNWTNYFQPPDLAVNKSSKDFLLQETQSWYYKKELSRWKLENSLTKLKLMFTFP